MTASDSNRMGVDSVMVMDVTEDNGMTIKQHDNNGQCMDIETACNNDGRHNSNSNVRLVGNAAEMDKSLAQRRRNSNGMRLLWAIMD